MDKNETRRMVAALDTSVPREGARVRLAQHGGGPDESHVVANERGYLRLGIEFLKATWAPPSQKDANLIDVDIDYLLTEDSEIQFEWWERREDLLGQATGPTLSGRIIMWVVIVLLGAAAVLTIIGLMTVVSWLVA